MRNHGLCRGGPDCSCCCRGESIAVLRKSGVRCRVSGAGFPDTLNLTPDTYCTGGMVMRVERALVGLLLLATAASPGCGRLASNLPPSSRLMEPGPGVGGPGPGVIPPAGSPYGMYGGAVNRFGPGAVGTRGMGGPMGPGGPGGS